MAGTIRPKTGFEPKISVAEAYSYEYTFVGLPAVPRVQFRDYAWRRAARWRSASRAAAAPVPAAVMAWR